jgi:hypothetical protein
MGSKLVESVSVSDHRVSARAGSEITPEFLSEEIWVESRDLSFAGLSDEVAALPLILDAAPIIWSLGLQLEVKADDELLRTLGVARGSMRELWPQFDWNGVVTAEAGAAKSAHSPAGSRTALLFSGGLDSTFSAFSLLDENPILLTVHGGRDLALADESAWAAVATTAENFAGRYGLRHHSLRSNFTAAVTPALEARFSELPVSYWAAIQHGLGLTGVALPAVAALGANRLVVSATHSTGHTSGWGSHPTLEGQLRWNDVQVEHFGYDHDRTAKVRAIARIADERDIEIPPLIVCTRRSRDGNCLRCAKCLRTLGSVLVVGSEPRSFGFAIEADEAREHLRENLQKMIDGSANERYAWGAIIRAAQVELETRRSDRFLKWLAKQGAQKAKKNWWAILGSNQ